MSNDEIADVFNEMADLLELSGEDGFRITSYRRAARTLEGTRESASALWRAGRVDDLPGIGKTLAAKIGELTETGRLAALDKLRGSLPPGLRRLLDIPGLGPKTASRFFRELGISDLAELEAAARAGRIRDLSGMGARTEANLLAGLERYSHRSRRLPLAEAGARAGDLADALRASGAVTQVEVAGSVRRSEPTIGDLDVVAAAVCPEDAVAAFVQLPGVVEVKSQGAMKAAVLLDGGLQADLEVVAPTAYGSLLQHFTGSKDHNIDLREHAQRRGWSISEHGLIPVSGGERIPCATEQQVYDLLGLPCFEPELRQGAGEIEAALTGRLPTVVGLPDIRGDLHAHTDWSDGKNTLLEMARAAEALGYEYLAITDHSQGRAHAGGLSPDRLRRQAEAVREAGRQAPGITLLHGSEVDIRADGSLDFSDEILAGLDFVVASVHSAMRQPADVMTQRLIRAVQSPHVDLLGHPSGRLLGSREGYEFDLEAVLRAAAAAHTAVEISAQPSRLDLDGAGARVAVSLGTMLSVDTDAHAAEQLGRLMHYGIAQARRGWVTPARLLTALSLADLRAWLGHGA